MKFIIERFKDGRIYANPETEKRYKMLNNTPRKDGGYKGMKRLTLKDLQYGCELSSYIGPWLLVLNIKEKRKDEIP